MDLKIPEYTVNCPYLDCRKTYSNPELEKFYSDRNFFESTNVESNFKITLQPSYELSDPLELQARDSLQEFLLMNETELNQLLSSKIPQLNSKIASALNIEFYRTQLRRKVEDRFEVIRKLKDYCEEIEIYKNDKTDKLQELTGFKQELLKKIHEEDRKKTKAKIEIEKLQAKVEFARRENLKLKAKMAEEKYFESENKRLQAEYKALKESEEKLQQSLDVNEKVLVNSKKLSLARLEQINRNRSDMKRKLENLQRTKLELLKQNSLLQSSTSQRSVLESFQSDSLKESQEKQKIYIYIAEQADSVKNQITEIKQLQKAAISLQNSLIEPLEGLSCELNKKQTQHSDFSQQMILKKFKEAACGTLADISKSSDSTNNSVKTVIDSFAKNSKLKPDSFLSSLNLWNSHYSKLIKNIKTTESLILNIGARAKPTDLS